MHLWHHLPFILFHDCFFYLLFSTAEIKVENDVLSRKKQTPKNAGTLAEQRGKLHKVRVGEWVDCSKQEAASLCLERRGISLRITAMRSLVGTDTQGWAVTCNVKHITNNPLMPMEDLTECVYSMIFFTERVCSCCSRPLTACMDRIVLIFASAAPLTSPAYLGPVFLSPFQLVSACLVFPDSSCSAFPLLPHHKAHPSNSQFELSSKWRWTPCSDTMTGSQRVAAD